MKLTHDSGYWWRCTFPFNRTLWASLLKFPGVHPHPKTRGLMIPEDVIPFLAVRPTTGPLYPPMVHDRLYDYQNVGVTGITWNQRVILNYAPGLGKTPTTIVSLSQMAEGRTLIVCPAIVRESWRREIDAWWANHPTVAIIRDGKDVNTDASSVITSYELLHHFTARSFEYVVFDELHFLKKEKSKRTQQAFALRQSNPYARYIGLTGTPITNEPKDLWSQLQVIYPGRFGKYWDFARRYCNVEENEYGTAVYGLNPINADELRTRLDQVAHRVTAEEVAHLLPALQVSTRFIKPKRMKSLKDIESIETIQEAMAPAKVTATLDVFDEAKQSGHTKVCILTHFKATAHDLFDRLRHQGENVYLITGDVQERERYQILDRAEADPSAVVVCTMHSVGIGINNMKFFQTAIFAEMDWQPGVNEQALLRFRRVSSTHSTNIVFIVLEGTSEEAISIALRRKIAVINTVAPDSVQTRIEELQQSDEDFLAELRSVAAGMV